MNSVCFGVMYAMEFTSICLYLLKLGHLGRDWCKNRLGRNHFHKHRLATCGIAAKRHLSRMDIEVSGDCTFWGVMLDISNVCKEGKQGSGCR